MAGEELERAQAAETAADEAQRVRLRVVRLPHVSKAATENITLGVRKKRATQSTGNRLKKHGQDELLAAWRKTTPFEKLVMLLLAEHKTLSVPQVKAFFALPAGRPHLACEGYLSWLEEKYSTPLPPDRIFTAPSPASVYNKVEALKRKGLIAGVKNSANNLHVDKALAPSLLSVHYFLSELGTQVVAAATKTPVSFVANYETYAFETLMHLSEANDFFVSSIAAAQDLMNEHPDEVGILDVVAWLHEGKTEHQFELEPGELTVFKTDGMMVLFSSLKTDFIDVYLEHDTGRMPADKVRKKTVAFLNFVLYRKGRQSDDEPFRRPVLLFVATSDSRVATYRENIHKAVVQAFPQQLDYINAFGRIAVASTEQIKQHSPLGEVWQVMDLRTGKLSRERFNLLTVSW